MGKMSIKNGLFLTSSTLLLLAILFTVMISQYFTERIFYDSTVREHRREMALITNSLQTELEHIADYQMSIALDNTVISALDAYPKLSTDGKEYTDVRSNIRKKVNSIIGMNQEVFQWDIITLDNTFLNVSGYNFISSIDEALGKDYFLKENTSRGVVLKGPFLVEHIGVNKEPTPVFVMSKQIVDLDTLEPLGYIGFFLFESHIAEIFEQNIPADIQSEYYILSDEHRILSATDKSVIGQSFTEVRDLTEKQAAELSVNGMCVVKNKLGQVFYTKTAMEKYNWSVVYATPVDFLMNSQRQASLIIIAVGLAICILSLFATHNFSSKVTKPIIRLSEKMRNYYAEKPTQKITHVQGNEIQNLYSGFESMVEDSKRLMDQIYLEQEEKSNYKFQLIQAQIKPHFLYNTLETVKSLIDIGMYDQAGESIMALSKFYRMSLNDGNDITTVEKEIELTKQYMYIQKMRYTEYLDYEIDDCIGMENYLIPKLILQPLLENAIYHGIKVKADGGCVVLRGEQQGDFLQFTIEDNGVGMGIRELVLLEQRLSGEEHEKQSFGLYSINRRIQLFFGNEYGIQLESEKNRFMRVTLRIPAITTENRKMTDVTKKEIEYAEDSSNG